MSESVVAGWDQANQRYLMAALALVKHALERYLAQIQGNTFENEQQITALQRELAEAEATLPAPANLMRLCATFKLSAFERDVVLLCAGIELDSQFAALCARILGYADQSSDQIEKNQMHSVDVLAPTFSLALAALPGAHWDALTPTAPLRYWQLLSVENSHLLTKSPLYIDEYVLHYLTGVSYPDTALSHLITPLPVGEQATLVPSHHMLVSRMIALWSHATDEHGFACLPIDNTPSKQAVIELCGEDTTGKQAIAASVCNALGLHLNRIYCSVLPTIQKELTVMLSLWEREAALHREVLLLDCSEYKADDTVRGVAILHVMQHLRTPLIIVSREQLSFSALDRPVLTLNVAKPALSEQRALWQQALAGCDLDSHIDRLVAQFHLSAATIQSTVATVIAADQQPTTQDEAGSLLWDTCRNHARPVLDELAQRIEPRASWHDLVLPETHQQLLQEIIAQVQQRTTVYETWNFRPAGVHGVGVSALFAGPSGTGKTLAAEVIAHMLQLDLYRVDLSAVVSKYIGETEKNLRRIFDAAEEGGVVLLFDEADALFGKRGEVKDSHDRYANIEVSYLLQRMEAYRGLAILTTNFKHALDAAFLRRIRFVIHFPFPDVAQRTEIWRRIFPASLPTSGLDIHKLARLNIAGGNIRNIAFNAAFLAAAAGESLQMKHLLRATHIEYAKLEKLLTDVEIGGWLCSAMSTVE